ncbi:hypothetical protein [Micromonospora chersina]|uniref:hypothetical protein n=1 Tax=Micromonospora chersina TaxID=47854 RepID=UPI0033B29690
MEVTADGSPSAVVTQSLSQIFVDRWSSSLEAARLYELFSQVAAQPAACLVKSLAIVAGEDERLFVEGSADAVIAAMPPAASAMAGLRIVPPFCRLGPAWSTLGRPDSSSKLRPATLRIGVMRSLREAAGDGHARRPDFAHGVLTRRPAG